MRFRLLLSLMCAGGLLADVGSLIPTTKQAPDAAILSLDEMSIDIQIDGSGARVQMRQIFASHVASVSEGNYVFALPGGALVSDFAVWDGPVRIPGVILERKRAEQLYENIRLQAIDPGLLQMGESDSDAGRRTSVFSAKVVPIPPFGSKRVELEYHQRMPLENLVSYLAIPLKPEAYRQQTVGRLIVNLDAQSTHTMEAFEVAGKSFPLRITEKTGNRVRASLDVRNFALTEDFAVTLRRAAPKAAALTVAAQRVEAAEPGYFEASLVLPPEPPAQAGPPRRVTALFDASLSMQWDKLERSYAALAKLLTGLRAEDQFDLFVFNSAVTRYGSGPSNGGAAEAEKALAWLKEQPLRGATNLSAALDAALTATAVEGASLVLFTDGGASDGEIRSGKIAEAYAKKWAASKRPRTFVFAVGDDANVNLLRSLARNDGVLETINSTETPDFKLNAFLSKLQRRPVPGLALATDANLSDVYALQEQTYGGSEAAWVGRYKRPARTVFQAGGAQSAVTLPAQESAHPQLPRTWAKARVDALLEKIERDGEDRATIEEIIRLSRKYKFVTPYTSFLAAPRALLRPRLIRPGDPVLRVHTDKLISSVVAVFPFGLVKPLRYLPGEQTWQTRFLAPVDMADGTHSVNLILRDRNGNTYKETRTFAIASKPPIVRTRLEKKNYRPGETVWLRASASATTRTVSARMYGVAPVMLRWDAKALANAARFTLPKDIAPGRYTITVTAEDMAHNIGSEEVSIDVLP
ncbi:MAG TPA: VIT domain-containing protein [Bryobacteraceae bacterium]|nr:VIT domain-containing protein [Bryobacteraceae bacterium]